MELGISFKKIRRNKGYSQLYLVDSIISQGSYSKFEDGKSSIKANKFLELLNKIHMSPNEFIFISNGYKYTEEQQLVREFFNLPYNDVRSLKLVKDKIIHYLSFHDDVMFGQLLIVCDALIKLSSTNDIDSARKIVMPVWEKLSNQNSWYLVDIQILNVVLYLFSVDVAIEMTKYILKRLDMYKGHSEANSLHFTLRINLAYLLINDKNYKEALSILEYTLNNYRKKMPYQSLALCFSRKSLCLQKLGVDSSNKFLQKAQQLLDIYDDESMIKLINKEYEIYSSKESI